MSKSTNFSEFTKPARTIFDRTDNIPKKYHLSALHSLHKINSKEQVHNIENTKEGTK